MASGPKCKPTPECFSRRAVEYWQQLNIQEVLGSLAPSTQQAYECTVVAFVSYAGSTSCPSPRPNHEVLLLWYLASMGEQGLSRKTINIHLSTISFCNKAMGLVTHAVHFQHGEPWRVGRDWP